MVSTLSKNWRDWPTPPILEDTIYDNHKPIGVLRGLIKAKEKGDVWFHADELENAGRAWMEAAKCSVRDSIEWRDFMEQAKKFASWWRQIMDEQQESGVPQAMLIEQKDYPHRKLLDDAIAALERNQIGAFH